ncbi:hypothetical protein N431DRAFT_471348 [Stipitochalara longipes BDJ]|nr:hypothetical protein N431DRAFT_471348 [Stipitochalara longipes BDJ]
MSKNTNRNPDSSRNSGYGTYTSLVDNNGSFGSTFWHNKGTNDAACRSDEEAWSVTANTSTVGTSESSRDDNESCKHEQIEKVKRVA